MVNDKDFDSYNKTQFDSSIECIFWVIINYNKTTKNSINSLRERFIIKRHFITCKKMYQLNWKKSDKNFKILNKIKF